MTGRTARFAYAYGRLGARLGTRPAPADWARLQAIADAVSYIDAARRTPVAALMEGLAPGQSIHAMEQALRRQWRAVVAQVSRWCPENDRYAIAWLSLLPLLPAIEHLASGESALPWMEADARLVPFVEASGRETDAATREAAVDVFQPAFAGDNTVAGCWLAHWKTLWPASPGERAILEHLVAAVKAKTGSTREMSTDLPSLDISDRIFLAAFRKNRQSLAASVAYLGLVANDLRRLRGQIAVRLALPSRRQDEVAA